MPESRNRSGHPYRKPADVPASQRVKGRILWAIMLAVFGALIAYFAVGNNYPVLIIVGVVSATLGYIAGKAMEKQS